ncbi:MAG: site-specific DNA-methyltransferase [Sedimentibacter sp.]|uniref:DNA-methyltransferase n=1 Tax=Sedimentibacter sp. TaxID=1960295 RepID=UPI002980A892|nr:site-specific DNA-methyltransferase [Sedimentibacter sp.]MDW5300732.1 site-specific DNA-methyltransferase [Sedimentibacter sp.]
MKVNNQYITERMSLYNGDSCEAMKDIPSSSVHFSIYSPPFASLYTYSNSNRDLGNCRSNDEFFQQFKFIANELFRILKPGRLMSVHCMDIPAMKERDGYIGLKDFPGDLIRLFQECGFIYHSRTIIWKDPLVEATRTKALGLMHKQLCKDSSMCRNGLPDYLITMRKPGDNEEPIKHPNGLTRFIGEDEPDAPKQEPTLKDSRKHRDISMAKVDPVYSHQVWRRYASPVWMDIDQGYTLNRSEAREEKDERHICPLQLQVIERAIELWTNPGDIVFTPFLGIGSEAYQALKMKRRAVGIELKESYYNQAVKNCQSAIEEENQISLF